MRCPLHPDAALETCSIDPGIEVNVCRRCDGKWMTADAYWRWRDTLPEALPNLDAADGGEDLAADSYVAKLCPRDGGFLTRHQVGYGLRFDLDRCARCGGVWLDRGEWEALRQRQMHDDLHLIFTSSWQAEVRRQRKAHADEKRLVERLGEADYQRSAEVREWLETKGQNSSAETLGPLLGFLLDGLGDIIQ